MQNPDAASLPEGLAAYFTPDRQTLNGSNRFACRPLAARSSERSTVFGVFGGRIGLPTVPEFKAALSDLSTEEALKIILDFSESHLSRSALGTLVAFAASVHGRNKRLYLYRPSPQVRGALHELGLSNFFSFLNSEDDVIATLII